MVSGFWGHLIPELRVAGLDALRLLREHDLDESEEADIGHQLWKIELKEVLDDQEFESGWHYIKAAALGFKVFEGPRRLCRVQLKGLPVGIVCNPIGIQDLLQDLFYAMDLAGMFEICPDLMQPAATWKFPVGNRTVVELVDPGERVARMMDRQHTGRFCVAALHARLIAHWADNHRRLVIAA